MTIAAESAGTSPDVESLIVIGQGSSREALKWQDAQSTDTSHGLPKRFFQFQTITSLLRPWLAGSDLPLEESRTTGAIGLPVKRRPTGTVWNWTIGRDELAGYLDELFAVDVPPSDTSPHLTPQQLDRKVERIFRAAEDLHFEDGMDSPFSRDLVTLVTSQGRSAYELLTYWIVLEKASPEVATEALRWLGAMEDEPSYHFRRWLLERSLRLSSPTVRDGAGLGLAAMDDPHAIPHLREAIAPETCQELRELLEQVLTQLMDG